MTRPSSRSCSLSRFSLGRRVQSFNPNESLNPHTLNPRTLKGFKAQGFRASDTMGQACWQELDLVFSIPRLDSDVKAAVTKQRIRESSKITSGRETSLATNY